MRATRARAAALTVVVLAAALSHLNTLRNGFVYDDIPQVVRNPWLRDLAFLPTAFSSSVWTFQGVGTNYYRPMMHALLSACYQIFGLAPAGYHALNLLLHALNALLVYLLLDRLIGAGLRRPPGRFLSPALAGALLFAVHPVGTEAVAWISALPEISFAFFALLALVCAVDARGQRRTGAATGVLVALLVLLAALCKETALVLPLVLLLPAFGRRAGSSPQEGSGAEPPAARPARAWSIIVPLVAAVVVYLVLRLRALGALAPLSRHPEMGAGEVAINGLALFSRYLAKLLLPVHLSAYHSFQPVGSPLTPWALGAIVAAAAFLVALVAAWRKDRLVFSALMLIALPLLPVLYVPALGENIFAERYLYFPQIGLSLLVAALLDRAAGHLARSGAALPGGGTSVRRDAAAAPGPARLRTRAAKSALPGALLLIATSLLGAATFARNAVWRDDLTLWSDAVAKDPAGAVPHYNLACHLRNAGRIDEAIAEFRAAIARQPAPVAYLGLGEALERERRLPEAIAQYRSAVTLAPRDVEARIRLGQALLRAGDRSAALDQLRTALALEPGNARAAEALRAAEGARRSP